MRQLVATLLLATAVPAAAQQQCRQPEAEVRQGEARLHMQVEGKGPPVLMIPSLGRGPADFDRLAADLVRAGFTSIRYDPRWFGRSDGPEDATLHDLAADAAAVAGAACPGIPVAVIGHALGNRIARAMAAAEPDIASTVILLAAGGQVPIAPEIARAISVSASQGLLPEADRLAALQLAFFAPGQKASAWLTGWSPRAAELQGKAVRATRDRGWMAAGRAPLLVVQPTRDPVAPFANGQALATELGERVTLLSLDHASHAILPEQPAAVSAVVIAWLGGVQGQHKLQAIVDQNTETP